MINYIRKFNQNHKHDFRILSFGTFCLFLNPKLPTPHRNAWGSKTKIKSAVLRRLSGQNNSDTPFCIRSRRLKSVLYLIRRPFSKRKKRYGGPKNFKSTFVRCTVTVTLFGLKIQNINFLCHLFLILNKSAKKFWQQIVCLTDFMLLVLKYK